MEGCKFCNSANDVCYTPSLDAYVCKNCIGEQLVPGGKAVSIDLDVVNSIITLLFKLSQDHNLKGIPEAAIALATVLDALCERLNMDPQEILASAIEMRSELPTTNWEGFRKTQQ